VAQERIVQEKDRLTREMSQMGGSTDKHSVKLRKQYEKRLADLQATITRMGEDAKKGEREMDQKRMAVSQLETLRKRCAMSGATHALACFFFCCTCTCVYVC